MGYASMREAAVDRLNEDAFQPVRELLGKQSFGESYPQVAENLRQGLHKAEKILEEVRKTINDARDPSVDATYEVKVLREENTKLRESLTERGKKVLQLTNQLEDSEKELD